MTAPAVDQLQDVARCLTQLELLKCRVVRISCDELLVRPVLRIVPSRALFAELDRLQIGPRDGVTTRSVVIAQCEVAWLKS